jgi:superkiller protein 3
MSASLQQPRVEPVKTIKANIEASDLIADYEEFLRKPKDEQIRLLSQNAEMVYRGSAEKLELSLNNDKVTLLWSISKNSSEVESINIEALSLIRRKEFTKAIDLWKKIIEKECIDPDCYFNMSLAYFELKDYLKALEKCRETIKICPIYFKAHFVMGSIYSKNRQFEEAENHFKNGLKFQPDNVAAHINLGAVYSILKKHSEAIQAFEKVIALSPREARAYLGLGKLYAAIGEVDNANRCFRAVIKIDSNGKLGEIAKKSLLVDDHSNSEYSSNENLEDRYAEGYQYFIKGDYAKAAEAYKSYLSQKSSDADVWASLAICNLRQGAIEEAIQSISRAMALQPKKAVIHKQAAIIYDACNLFEECAHAAQKAIELGKQDSVTCSLLGKSYFSLGKIEQSLRLLQEAIKMNPHNLNARFYCSQAFKKIGQKDSAKEQLEEIIWSKAESPLKDKARKEIQNLN